jgi:hypothetical protein
MNPAPSVGEKTINGAGQHGADDNYENSVERRFLRKRTFAAQSHHYQSRNENNYPAD